MHKSSNEIRFLEQLGIQLGDARRTTKLTQHEVAAKLNCSTSHINDIESGNANTTVYELIRLCEIYHVSPCQMIKHHESKCEHVLKLTKEEQQLIATILQKLINSPKRDKIN